MDATGCQRLAIIDLGTVSSRMLLAEAIDGSLRTCEKRTVITDLGEGVDATGELGSDAISRVLEACRGFVAAIGEFGPCPVSTTLTSAARDAANGDSLILGLEELGLTPQIISGETEAALTFYGVVHDFANERIAVADSGGGSTELVVGRYAPGARLELEDAVSLNIGCRRMTERFFRSDPPCGGDMGEAARCAREAFTSFWSAAGNKPDRLVAVGGTVTTLAAMARGMMQYDSSLVHLSVLTLQDVEQAIARLSQMTTDQIAELDGIQPKRAPVILAGALVIRELLVAGGYDELTISENSLMAGMAATMLETIEGENPSIGWTPRMSW